jgi:hypothetical protein
MRDGDQGARGLGDVPAYAELAIYCTLKASDVGMSHSSFRDALLPLRDLLQDLAGYAGADEALIQAHTAARQRACDAGEKICGWPVTCPRRVIDLVEAMSRRIEALASDAARSGDAIETSSSS